jgi:hypothetical protein
MVGAWLICSTGVPQIADDAPTWSKQKSGFADVERSEKRMVSALQSLAVHINFEFDLNR